MNPRHAPPIALFLTAVLAWSTVALPADPPEQSEKSTRLTVDHLERLADVSDPQPSPEGDWIAYTVTSRDFEEDEARSRVWMVPAKGDGDAVPLSSEDHSSSHPRWSPDGQYLAFLSGRDDAPAQVWRLFRAGGEAQKITDTPQTVEGFEWSPDSTRLLLLLKDPSAAELEAHEKGEDSEEQTPPPWVIDRQQFKRDYVGYLDRRRTHIHVLDLASGKLTQLTHGDYDDSEPTWSPDGKSIAFTSNRTEHADDNYNTDIWVVSADPQKAPSEPRRITRGDGPDQSPAWSPDGRWIAHTSVTDADAILYATFHLAVSAADGGGTRVLTGDLDRMIFSPRFAPDGKRLWFLLEDSGEQNLARIRPQGGPIERVIGGEQVVLAFTPGADGALAALLSTPSLPPEVFRLSGRKLEQRTFTNRDALAGLELGAVEKVRFRSADGTEIEGFAIKPPGFRRRAALPDDPGHPRRAPVPIRLQLPLRGPALRRQRLPRPAPQPARLHRLRPGLLPGDLAGLGRPRLRGRDGGRRRRRCARLGGPRPPRRDRLVLRRHAHQPSDHEDRPLQGRRHGGQRDSVRGQLRPRHVSALVGAGTGPALGT
jgi:dipeptidyl aminopeptidase/acylaminoacyl peptidase